MLARVPELDQLPRQTVSDVKNKWREVVRGLRETGSVAITNHAEVEFVLLDVSTYRQLVAGADAMRTRERAVLEQLADDFDRRLAVLQQPDSSQKIDAIFASGGKLVNRPKAGGTY
ncbi:type II toxin-antitoxin system prevent-host-death family antitoxin [Caenimonas koreensis]|uniref:Type II toxin-antitoxin system prevent-host-death family antitoxin n=1 Tax=Caenimonas koreensis DSM 17982 TaxID=1121255 RepID=A0A844B9G1_9BURK|nr:type II toxin-antitoxin system prevent-host-death family antitoxin [Caenimonas koreensis]MRD49762.1 type II toxin-antitoxin system prevent-host-death family antitoxin [Caenimonas koreensis DSM 17982]